MLCLPVTTFGRIEGGNEQGKSSLNYEKEGRMGWREEGEAAEQYK